MKKVNGVLLEVKDDDIILLEKNPTEFWKGVTSIGNDAFRRYVWLKNIEIPNTVTSIGDYAFYYCESLTNLKIPDSVTSIGDSAFVNCKSLTNLKIPDNVTRIGDSSFADCKSLKNIEIPNTVTSIGDAAFANCESLKNIEIPDSVQNIDGYAFIGCKSLTNIIIPDSVTSIGERAFSNCESLTKIKIPDSVTSIGDCAFSECKSLKNIEIPNTVTSIGDFAFSSCTSLKNIEIPNTVTSIGNSAFVNCKSLTNIKIPDSVTSIGYSVFEGCEKLTSIEIPNTVTRIDDNAFRECRSLKNIEIPNTVTSIGGYAFYYCESLTNIKIPDSVTSIGDYAFRVCKSLKNIEIPDTVRSIEDSTFAGCESLTNIKIPDDVTNIGFNAFGGCRSLKNIEIPNTVTNIGDYAFYCCESLTNLKIPDSVTSIGDEAFFDGVQKLEFQGKSICGDLLNQEMLEMIKNNPRLNFKHLNSVYELAKEQNFRSEDNCRELVALSVNLGILEPKSTVVETGKDKAGKPIMSPVNNIVYTFLQGIIKSKQIELNRLHMDLQAMQVDSYNEAFMKFVVNKSNWSDIKNNLSVLSRVYDWFKARTELDLTQTGNPLMPTREEDRFKVLVYETAENDIDRMHWRVPTMENLLKEFEQQKFVGVNTQRDREIAEELAKYNIYTQKHFNKAKEIDKERSDSGVKDILAKPVKQGRIESLDQYRSEKQKLRAQTLSDSAEILHDQIEDTSSVFTYELLSKSDPANFAMGCLTSCCATLYGSGAGAMRAMIIHPDMQPLVIRDFDNNIISFGIIYVNRKEGYAVVNDFEVNKKYENLKQREAIYQKAMQGINAFVKEYNQENPSQPIKKVTCGISPNWDAINIFIRGNPQSEILKAPNFNDFKYNGSGSWPGDWHREQYEILKVEDEHVL